MKVCKPAGEQEPKSTGYISSKDQQNNEIKKEFDKIEALEERIDRKD